MAKAKKAKNEEQRGGDNSEAIVKHQKLCLSIDMDNRRVYGYTELQIVIPEDGIVGLHSDNLVIERVTVDGEPARFEVFPHYQHLDPKDRWRVVSSATSAADASGSVYLSSLELELLPNLLIMCSNSSKPDNRQEEDVEMDKGEELSFDANRLGSAQNVKNVRIEYWVEKAETGIHFNNNVLHTNNQLRRARCWFPCIDDSLQCCCYDLEFTVPSDFVAVSSGTLLHQVLTNDDPPRKTYVYRLNVPVAAQWISLAVGPFEILPDRHGGLLSHFCLPANLSKLQNTVGFFHNAFSHFEDYLSSSFPFGSFTQVFIGPEMAISSWSLGASVNIFSSHVMFDERIIDQTIETRIRLAYALARQWFGVYITPEAPNDEWLLDGLAGFLTDSFIKRFLGNNEVRYRRYKANNAVCQADDSAGTALSSPLASKDLYGTQCIGFYGKIRSWKSVAVLQMLEKQMGPESFRKILQSFILRARDGNRALRTLSTKEFRHSANKIGNLERPFLKEFFPRWVGSCGCPVLKMGFSYNKRKNMLELAVLRGCTSRPDSWTGVNNINHDSENRESDVGWPGMMSIRVHELDGMYDHPILPMAGEPWQLLEIQCHSKLAAKRVQKTKKGTKADGSDDNGDAVANTDVRSNSESPLLWLRADPEMEYLAEIHCNQPVQMWINQLEKDKDVIAQAQAIAVLEALPQLSFSVVNALNSFLCDSKAFWRVRIQAAYTLATTTSEDTDWTGLFHLINFYKSRRFDPNINLPRPNDFHDFQEYFVLEAIPLAIASVRSTDKKSPREAVEFILQLLKYNDNTGNTYSDVFWLAALVRSVGELEFGQQSIVYLPSLLKRIDRLLQFDRLMPSHNGVLTISCIQALAQCALKLSEFIPLDSVTELIKPYVQSKTWQIRIVASRSLLELECQSKGIDAALMLFISHLNNEASLRGQTKLGVCALRLSQMANQSRLDNSIQIDTLVALLRLLESPVAFNNITLRHYIFCILQVLAGRSATLFGVPRDEILRMGHTRTFSELKIIFAALINQSKPQDPSSYAPDNPHNIFVTDDYKEEADAHIENHNLNTAVINDAPDVSLVPITQGTTDAPLNGHEHRNSPLQVLEDDVIMLPKVDMLPEIHEPMEQLNNILGYNLDDSVASRKADSLINADKESEPVFDLVQDSLIMAEALNEANTLLALKDSNTIVHDSLVTEEANNESGTVSNRHELNTTTFMDAFVEPNALVHDSLVTVEATKELKTLVHDSLIAVEATKEPNTLVHDSMVTVEATKEGDTVSISREIKKPKLKIRVKQSSVSIRAEIPNTRILNNQDADRGPSSSLSVDASRINIVETVSASNQNFGDANSSRDVGSRITASTADCDELVKELQCTADSSIVSFPIPPPNDLIHISTVKQDLEPQTSEHTYSASLDIRRNDAKESSGLPTDVQHSNGEGKKKKKDKDKKRKRNGHNDDPEYLELKRQKKEKKRRKKEMAKILADTSKVDLPSNEKRVSGETRPTLLVLGGKGLQPGTRGDIVGGQGLISSAEELRKRNDPGTSSSGGVQLKPGESTLASAAVKQTVNTINPPQSTTSNKIKIKLKTRTIDKP